MTLKAESQARLIEFETTRYTDGSVQVRARLQPTDGRPGAVTSSPLDSSTVAALIAMLEGVRGSVHVSIDPRAPTPGWMYSEAPRDVRLLVTAREPEGGFTRMHVATLSSDYDGERWFSQGRRLQHVIAWMFLPPEAKEPA